MTVITNNQYRHLVYRNDVPSKVLAEQFDYLDEDVVDGFFVYKNEWYHINDFMAYPESSKKNWDGYSPDTYFSGIAIKLSDDMESIKVGRYYY